MAGRREMKVVLLPYVAFGHMMPFYQLAIALAKSGVHVYYISTPKNIQRLPKVPQNLSPLLELVPITFPQIPNSPLPEGAEATIDIPPEMLTHLFMAYDRLEQPFKQFVADNKPDWLIIDFSPHWAVDVARECNVPIVNFAPFSTATYVFFGPPDNHAGAARKPFRYKEEHFTSPPPWVTFPSKVAFLGFEARNVINSRSVPSDVMSVDERMAIVLRESKGVAIRTCREIEGEYLTLYAQLLGKPVIPMGFLAPELPEKREPHDENWAKIFGWLDDQKPKSVVFVGFGSECRLRKHQISEIATGLEASELPFIWLLRKSTWDEEDPDTLLSGFLDRTSERGKVCFRWAPQFEILANPAIGVTLFHSGWGSAIEALQFGHPLVVLPFIYDQSLNARLMVEKGLAIEVDRDEEDGSFKGKDIAKCLKQAMAEADLTQRGETLRDMIAAAGDRKLHDRYMDEFVKFLLENNN